MQFVQLFCSHYQTIYFVLILFKGEYWLLGRIQDLAKWGGEGWFMNTIACLHYLIDIVI